MEKKKVLLDLCDIGNPASGFGQIAKNYAEWYSKMDDESLQFHFLLPMGHETDYGPRVEVCYCRRKFHKYFRKGLPTVDLWHSTTQQQLKRRRGKCSKFVLTIHDLNYLTEKNWVRQQKHHFILQRAINQADAVTCISKYVGKQVEEQFDLKGKQVRVIYNGVEDITGKPEEKPSFTTGRPFFFAIGQIRPKKNFHLLVDMMRHFPDHDLYIAGDDHFAFAQVVREHIEGLETKNAYLVGKITDAERVWLYHHCEAFLFPSVGEGFGLPAIEAMQFGKPVFISSATCLPEICGDCATVWQSLQPDEMATVVKADLAGFGQDAAGAERRERVKRHAQEYSYDKNISAYMKLYKELLSVPMERKD